MLGAPILAVAGGALVALARPDSAVVAAPFLLLWGLSPLVARWVSRSTRRSPTAPALAGGRPDPPVHGARRTWRFFETFVGAGRQPPAPRQLPGGSDAGRRAPHVADEHRALPARDRRRARLRLARSRRPRRAARGHARDDGAARAVPRPLLQLVRHARPPAARAALRVDGRQRQPRRPPARARQRLRERDAPAAARCRGVRRHRGRALARRRTPRAPSAAADPPRRSTLGQLDESREALAAALRGPRRARRPGRRVSAARAASPTRSWTLRAR